MPEQQLPTAWWRRALAAVDGLDVAVAVSLALIAAGLLVLWGLGWAMLGTGGLGLAGTVTLLVRHDIAQRKAAES